MVQAKKVSKVPSETVADKELRVEINEDLGIPKFNFIGMWSIRDLLKVQRLLGREFRRYRKELIKTLAAQNLNKEI